MAGWREDLRNAVRSALKRPGRSLGVCMGLALGLGANVAVFSYLDFLLWAELPAREPARLVAVEQEAESAPGPFSYPDYRDRNRVLDGLVAGASFSSTVDTGSATVHAWGALVSGNYFSVLGAETPARPHPDPRGRSAGRRARGGPRRPVLAPRLLRRPPGAGAQHPPERPPGADRRLDAGAFPRRRDPGRRLPANRPAGAGPGRRPRAAGGPPLHLALPPWPPASRGGDRPGASGARCRPAPGEDPGGGRRRGADAPRRPVHGALLGGAAGRLVAPGEDRGGGAAWAAALLRPLRRRARLLRDLEDLPRLAGRAFEPQDIDGAPRVAIVNQALANALWPGRSALGQRLLLPAKPARPGVTASASSALSPAEVIGVVADTRAINLWQRPAPLLYLPLAQNPHRLMTLLVRTAGAVDPAGLQPALRRELRRSHPEMAILDVVPFALHLERSLWSQRMSSRFLAIFGALGLALAGLGLGSAMSFSVSRRTREIGVRIALGSTRGGVQGLVLHRALVQVAIGVLLGLAATLAFLRLLAGLSEGTETTASPLALLTATLVLFALGLAAAWLPARRAARIDPSLAFRAE